MFVFELCEVEGNEIAGTADNVCVFVQTMCV